MYLWKSYAGKDGRALLGSTQFIIRKKPPRVPMWWISDLCLCTTGTGEGQKWGRERNENRRQPLATLGALSDGIETTLTSNPGRRRVESTEGGENKWIRESKRELRGSWMTSPADLWLLALLKIEASPETFGRMPMTLSSEFREEFFGWKCLKSRVNDCFNDRQYDLVFKSLGSGHRFLLDLE